MKEKFKKFNGPLAINAIFCGKYDIPKVSSSGEIPHNLIAFSKCLSSTNYGGWVHFYEDDDCFERIWRNPIRYLPILKKYKKKGKYKK